ncbi:alpha/beta hydrolase [Myxococcota bacterium]|nr:alpha/beta hydrolase [Myxococcota bacterium]
MSILSYDSRGHGPHRVILLHGFLGCGRNLTALAQKWVKADERVEIILPDLRGHGESPPLSNNPTLTHLAEDLHQLVESLPKTISTTLVGHSLGGRVGLEANRLKQLFQTIVLLDIPPGPLPEHLPRLDTILEALIMAPPNTPDRAEMKTYFESTDTPPELIDWVLTNLRLKDGQYSWRIDRLKLWQLDKQNRKVDLWPVIEIQQEIQPENLQEDQQTRIISIRGADSPFVSEDDEKRLRKAKAGLYRVKGTGHFLHIQKADILADLLSSTLRFE